MKSLAYLIRITSTLILILGSIEICLQLWSWLHRTHQFQSELVDPSGVVKEVALSERIIYFVGDSFTYGLGASEKAYSYPAQFCDLLENQGLAYQCVNLGYPGTTSKDHFKVIEKLPSESNVILRTGLNDHWLSSDLYRANVLGQTYEFRILKFGIMLYRWLTASTDSKQPIHTNDPWLEMIHQKKLRIVLYGYPTEFAPTINLPKEFTKIPCMSVLRQSGLISGRSLTKRFLSSDLRHPNDLGYSIDAKVLFNALCDQNIFGLTPSQKLPLTNSQGDWLSLRDRYLKNRNHLASELDPLKQQHILRAMFHLSYTLSMLDANNQQISQDHHSIKRILTRGFRDEIILQILIASYHDEMVIGIDNAPMLSPDELRIYLAISRATTDPKSQREIFHLRSNEKFFKQFLVDYESIPTGFLKDLPTFFPISYCPRFKEISGISNQDLKIDDDWQSLLGKNLSDSTSIEKPPLTCELEARLHKEFWK